MNHKIISLIISMGGIGILYLISLTTQPMVVDIEHISDFEGKLVTITGTVVDYSNGKNHQLITVQQNNSTLLLFQEAYTNIQIGDIVKATGKIQKYNDKFELIADEPESIDIISKWQNNEIQLKEIAENPTFYLNQNVNVSGYVDVIYDDYFQLIDEENAHIFLVKKPYIANLTLYPGKQIRLNALFTYEETQTRYLFDFRNDNHTIISINGE
jgi:hypothetical protein